MVRNTLVVKGIIKNEGKPDSKRAGIKRLSFKGKAFFEAQEKSFLIKEQCPGNKEEVYNYELYEKPVFSLEFLSIYLK